MKIVAAAVMVIFFATVAFAETVYQSPRLESDRALYDKLLFTKTVDNSADGLIFWWRNIIERDGTGIRIYFRSSGAAPGYSVCFRWESVDSSNELGPRFFCGAWYDKELHSREILSASEAAGIKSLTVESFDVEGDAAGWGGIGRPLGVLAHQKTLYYFEEPSVRASNIYRDPQLVQGNPLYEKLSYSTGAGGVVGESKLEWGRTQLTRDGGEVRIYFQSQHRVPDHYVCFQWRFVDNDGAWRARHFCADWLDQALHSQQILSASEASRVQVFHLHNFDVDIRKRFIAEEWSDQGYPNGMISHQYTAYTLVDPPTPSIAATSPPVSDGSASPDSDDGALWAIGKCALMYLGEESCKHEVEQHLGRSIGGLSCAAFLQQAFGGRIDPAELAIGAMADIASDSKSEFWQFVGGLTKVGLFAKCVDDNN